MGSFSLSASPRHAAEAIAQYLEAAQITRGPIFRPQAGSRASTLANRALTPTAMYLVIIATGENIISGIKAFDKVSAAAG